MPRRRVSAPLVPVDAEGDEEVLVQLESDGVIRVETVGDLVEFAVSGPVERRRQTIARPH